MTAPIEEQGDHVERAAIEGEQLSAVTFVQDYLQLHFDCPTITAITWPVVAAGSASFEFDTPGYRDQLCGLIAKHVVRAYVASLKELARGAARFPSGSIVAARRRETLSTTRVDS